MRVELLVIEGCANAAAAAVMLRAALDDAELSHVTIETVVVTTQEEAERHGFPGSPTIHIDGADPWAEPDAAPALACRLYHTASGLSGVPEPAALRRVLEPGRP